MLSRTAQLASGPARRALPAVVPAQQQVRFMGENPKQLLDKMTSTANIRKITSAMKMVSAAGLRKAETRLMAGRPFADRVMDSVFPSEPFPEDADEDYKGPVPSADTNLLLLITSDKGLCGAVNSFVCKEAKADVAAMNEASTAREIMIVGDKGRSQMHRMHGDDVTCTVEEAYQQPMNFATASVLADRALGHDFDAITMYYNVYKSKIAYQTSKKTLPNFGKEVEASGDEVADSTPEHLAAYEFEPEYKTEGLQNLFEFSLASAIYGAANENSASEMSSRMQAMENATNNAGELIEKLSLRYNRARQARITTELIEIISGAESLKG